MQRAKNITKNFRNRNKAFGTERRLNMTKTVFENQIHFPKAVGYSDIDQAFYEWVDKEIELVYSGNIFPTLKLFSTQRISEVSQNWQYMDEKGNINLNFKTVTREPNPQHGDNQGGVHNIPGHRDYEIFRQLTLEENGTESLQIYTTKQPTAANLIYTINVITTSYNMLNEANIKILNSFNGLEVYLFPNGYAMPMLLNSVGDESDYTLDDRKYYSQSYQIKVLGYIIKEDDFKVTKVPNRVRQQFSAGMNSRNKKKIEKFNINPLIDNENKLIVNTLQDKCKIDSKLKIEKVNEINFDEEYNVVNKELEVSIEEMFNENVCWEGTEDEVYVSKKVNVVIPFDKCTTECKFNIDENLIIETLQLNNIKDYVLKINGDTIFVEESDVVFNEGDEIEITITQSNKMEKSEFIFICYKTDDIIERNDLNSNEEIMVL